MNVTYNGYELPNVESVDRPRTSRRRSATPANWRGEYSLGTVPAAREITVRGYVLGSTWEALDAAWDAFNGAMAEGPVQKLFLSTGRFYWAEVASVSEFESNLVGAIAYEVVFYVADPYEYADPALSGDLGSSGATVVVGGTVAAEPTLTLVVSVALEGGLITITNSANDRILLLRPEAAATYTLNSRTQRITRGAGIAAEGETSGLLPLLEPGVSNTIGIAASDGAAVSAASLSWHNTFRN